MLRKRKKEEANSDSLHTHAILYKTSMCHATLKNELVHGRPWASRHQWCPGHMCAAPRHPTASQHDWSTHNPMDLFSLSHVWERFLCSQTPGLSHKQLFLSSQVFNCVRSSESSLRNLRTLKIVTSRGIFSASSRLALVLFGIAALSVMVS